jgi:ABC-type bacteriocin/lantibiotic exporter with double-glycine peptidase domain
MKRIKQRHRTSCGIACFAMVTGISYNKSIKKVFPRRKPYSLLTTNALKLVTALLKLKFEVDYYDNDKHNIFDIKNKAILIIKAVEGDGHAVVWDPESKRILDPDRKKPLSVKSYNKHLIFIIEAWQT